MGPWRTLMSRARGRPRYLSSSTPSSSSAASAFSSLSLAKADQHQPCPLAHNGRFVYESPDACPRLSERIWPGLDLGFAQKNDQKNVEAVLQDAKDFLLDSNLKEGLGRPDVGLPEGFLRLFEQKKAWLVARALPAETLTFKKPWLNAELSGEQNAPKRAEDVSLRLSMHDPAMQEPGVGGLEDSVIYADSVKRKRKKKMNKHKHRKLRRLARKSHK